MAARLASVALGTAAQNLSGSNTVTAATWGWSLAQGFLPINPSLIVAQVAIFTVLCLIFIFAFGIGPGKSILAAYITQAIIIAVFANYITRWLLGTIYGI